MKKYQPGMGWYFLYIENRALNAWFSRAYGDELNTIYRQETAHRQVRIDGSSQLPNENMGHPVGVSHVLELVT